MAMQVAGVAGLARRIAAPWPSAGGRLSSSPTETRVGGEVAWPGGLALPRHRCQTSPEMQGDAQTPSPGPAPFSPQDAASNPNVPEMRVLRHVFLLLRAFSLSRCLDQPTAVHRIWTFSTRSRTAWREARQGSADAGRGQSAEASAAGRRGALLPPLLRAHDLKKKRETISPTSAWARSRRDAVTVFFSWSGNSRRNLRTACVLPRTETVPAMRPASAGAVRKRAGRDSASSLRDSALGHS